MTLAEVIDTLQTWIKNADDEYDREEMGRVAGLKEALHEIKKIEICDDAISRDELLKAIDTWDKFGYTETGCFVREPKNDCVKYIHYDDVIKCIKCMPSVKPQQKTGHWIELTKLSCAEYSCYVCSECEAYAKDHGRRLRVQHYKSLFCPDCGLKMVEPQESEE